MFLRCFKYRVQPQFRDRHLALQQRAAELYRRYVARPPQYFRRGNDPNTWLELHWYPDRPSCHRIAEVVARDNELTRMWKEFQETLDPAYPVVLEEFDEYELPVSPDVSPLAKPPIDAGIPAAASPINQIAANHAAASPAPEFSRTVPPMAAALVTPPPPDMPSAAAPSRALPVALATAAVVVTPIVTPLNETDASTSEENKKAASSSDDDLPLLAEEIKDEELANGDASTEVMAESSGGVSLTPPELLNTDPLPESYPLEGTEDSPHASSEVWSEDVAGLAADNSDDDPIVSHVGSPNHESPNHEPHSDLHGRNEDQAFLFPPVMRGTSLPPDDHDEGPRHAPPFELPTELRGTSLPPSDDSDIHDLLSAATDEALDERDDDSPAPPQPPRHPW
jgi:hypothetical protein